jgi:tubulin polyglutamylase TTLL5
LKSILFNFRFKSQVNIRNAFTFYMYKIELRLIAESQLEDDKDCQQMELVLKFLKKASPNLSQEFRFYVPSRQLPVNKQKHMLSKQLHDFLHIYRKDTEQINIDFSTKRNDNNDNSIIPIKPLKNINEKSFQNFLYKCNEYELEEILSAYMKSSKDSNIFLGFSNNNINNNSKNVTKSTSSIDINSK